MLRPVSTLPSTGSCLNDRSSSWPQAREQIKSDACKQEAEGQAGRVGEHVSGPRMWLCHPSFGATAPQTWRTDALIMFLEGLQMSRLPCFSVLSLDPSVSSVGAERPAATKERRSGLERWLQGALTHSATMPPEIRKFLLLGRCPLEAAWLSGSRVCLEACKK